MKHILLIIASLFILKNAGASSLTVSGKVAGTWNVDTVNVTGDLRINADTSLVIFPGTRVIFQGHYEFLVLGSIRAIGLAENPILFTVADTTGFADTLSVSGGWHGFLFDQLAASADSSVFSFCRFEYGKAVANDTTGIFGGAMRIFNWNKIVISDCEFFHNLAHKWGGAIYAKHADILIRRTTFRENRCGTPNLPYGYGGGFSSVHSNPVVQYCIFDNNYSTGIGGGACFEYSDPVLQYNVFYQNFSGLGGGFAYLRSTPTRVASNNLVYGNEALFFGGGISIIRCNVVFSNNTIVNNHAAYGGGFYANDSACPSNYNTILYGNTAYTGQEVYIWDIRSAPNFFYCDVAGGVADFEGSGGHEGYIGTFENNLDTIPGFTGTSDHPFSLSGSSPIADQGTPDTASLQIPGKDIAGNMRIYNNRIDIGAYEWSPATGIISRNNGSAQLRIFPNPVRSDFSVSFMPDRPGTFSFTIYASDGKPLWNSGHIFCSIGKKEILVTANETGIKKWKNGLYLLRVSGDGFVATTPFVLINEP